MKRLKTTVVAGLLGVAMAMPVFANENPVMTIPMQPFSEADAGLIFETDATPMQLAALSQQEMKETEGAVWWFAPVAAWTVGGGIVGVGVNRWQTGSWEGSGRAFGAGATAGFYNSNLAVRAFTPVGAFVGGSLGAASWYRW